MEVNTIKVEIRKHHVTPGVNVLDLVRPGPAADTGADLLCATRVRIGHGGES